MAIVAGALLAGSGAYAATNWVVGLGASSSGEASAPAPTSITIVASSSAVLTNTLYPGGNGDVGVSIGNTNAYPVTITTVNLPTNTTYGVGYTNATLTTATGSTCDGTTSLVSWNYATGTSGSTHTLTTPLVVAANGTLVVTLTNDASMGTNSPNACEGNYFKMPSLTTVGATVGGTATTSPATDAWTS